MNMSVVRRIYSTFYLVLGIGVTWAAMTQDRVNYPSWALVGPNEFKSFHHAVLLGTQTYIIPFALLALVAGIPMIWLRLLAISRSLVIFVLAIGVLGGVVTTRMAIPIQKQMYREDPSHIPSCRVYVFFPARIASIAASATSGGISVSQTPCAIFTPPIRSHSSVIERISDCSTTGAISLNRRRVVVAIMLFILIAICRRVVDMRSIYIDRHNF